MDKGDSGKGIKGFARGVVTDVDDVAAYVQHLNGDYEVSDASKPRMVTSPNTRNYSPLVYLAATINMPRDLFNVDVTFTFGVPLTIVGDLDLLTKDIQAGKHEELLSRMTNEKRRAVMDALVAMCDSIKVESVISLPSEVSPSDPIVQSVDILEKPSSYTGLEDVLKNGPWMIRNSAIIMKKWTMNTRLCKDELTRILVWVKIHDVPIQVFLEDGFSIIASQIEVLKESLTMGVPLIEGLGKVSIPPTIVTSNVDIPTVKKINDGFQTVGKKKKKGKLKSTNGGQFGGQ
nr:hypothetical protein [Tanacetum cinerariifolium]